MEKALEKISEKVLEKVLEKIPEKVLVQMPAQALLIYAAYVHGGHTRKTGTTFSGCRSHHFERIYGVSV